MEYNYEAQRRVTQIAAVLKKITFFLLKNRFIEKANRKYKLSVKNKFSAEITKMRNYLQVLIFLIPIISFSQNELEGRYHKADLSGDSYEYLNFDKEGNFEYAKGGHLGEVQLIIPQKLGQ